MLLSPSCKRRFLEATLWFAAVHGIQVSWFAADRYVGSAVFFLLPLLALGVGAQFGLLALFVGRLTFFRILGISGGWVLCEWSRLYFLSGYSWNPSGLALSGTLYGMQMASLVGVFGMGFWIFLTNLVALKASNRFSWRYTTLWFALGIAPYLFGWAEVLFHDQQMEKKGETLLALVVQTAIYPEYKMPLNGSRPLSPQAQWERMLLMLSPFKESRPDLILFSESVVPYGVNHPLFHIEEIEEAFEKIFGKREASSSKTPFVGNSYWAKRVAQHFSSAVVIGLEANEKEGAFNSAFLFTPDSPQMERYEKRVLVPIAEYIPFAWCRPLCAKYGIVDSFTPGKEAKIFEIKRASCGLSICYEETYGHLMRESRIKGASLLLNLSNDVWYPRSRLPMVHFLHGRLRAVEAGIPLIRSCNTGVTCGVDSLGRVVGLLPYESAQRLSPAAALSLTLPLYHFSTFYTRFGDVPVVLFSSVAFALLCLSAMLKRKYFHLRDLEVYPLRKN